MFSLIHLTDPVGILKMSRIQFVDLDMSSEDNNVSGVVISKHEMRSKFEWWNPVGVSRIKQEIEETDAGKDTTETKKKVHMYDQLLHEVQEKLTEDEDKLNDRHDTEEEMDDESEEISHEQGETDGKSEDVNKERIATDQKSDDVYNEHKELDPVQKMEQQQEVENTDQQVKGEIDQKEQNNMDEIEVIDMDRNLEGNIKDVHVVTQNIVDQEIGEEKQESEGRDEQLDDACNIGATSTQGNVKISR